MGARAELMHEASILKLEGDSVANADWVVASWAESVEAGEFALRLRPVGQRRTVV